MQILIKEPDQRLDLSKVRRILSIHHMLAMGEVVLLSVPFRVIKANCPQASLSVIASDYACGFLPSIPCVDRSIPIERFGIFLKKASGHKRLLYRPLVIPLLALFLRQQRFDCVFIRDDERLPYTRYIRQAVKLARVPQVVVLKPFLTRHFNASTHVVTSYLTILNNLGFATTGNERPVLRPTAAGIRNAKNLLATHGLDPKRHRLIGISPISKLRIKSWDWKRVVSLCDRWADDPATKVLLFTTDRAYAETVVRQTRKPPIVVGLLAFEDLIALIAQCQAFVSVDTGPMHVAAALDVPTIGIFGPTSGQMFGPLGQRCQVFQETPKCSHYHPDAFFVANDQKFQQCYIQDRCLLAKHPCVDRVSAETVGAAVEALMA